MTKRDISTTDQEISEMFYKICVTVTFVAIFMSLVRFFTRGAYPPDGINIFYIGVLAIYSIHKEALHWLMEKEEIVNRRKGEVFVYVWFFMTIILYALNFAMKDYFNFSPEGEHISILKEITFLTLEVGAIFVASRFVKIFRTYYQRKYERRQEWRDAPRLPKNERRHSTRKK